MANSNYLPNLNDYTPQIREISVTEPVEGGPLELHSGTTGPVNLQALDLANRTVYLKEHADSLESRKTSLQSTNPLTYLIVNVFKVADGSGYQANQILTVNGVKITVTSVDGYNGGIVTFTYDTGVIYSTDPAGVNLPVSGGSGSGAIFTIVTRYASGDIPATGNLEFVPDGDPLVQESRMFGYIASELQNASFQKFIGYYGSTVPAAAQVVLKQGYLFHQDSAVAGAPPSTVPINPSSAWTVQRWNGFAWENTSDKYIGDQNHLWSNFNPGSSDQMNSGYYFFGGVWKLQNFFTDVTQYGRLAGGIAAGTPQSWTGYNSFSNDIQLPNKTSPASNNKVAATEKQAYDSSRRFGVCSTASATTAKTVTVNGDWPSAANLASYIGISVIVSFSNSVTVANATLNVNGSGAKAIYYRGASLAANVIKVGTYLFVFDGTYYQLVGETTASVEAQVALKANIASPTFTGTPKVPNKTSAAANDGTLIASEAQVYTVAQAVTSKANIASPTFTGTPTCPTPSLPS
jgi:hypothetical protein